MWIPVSVLEALLAELSLRGARQGLRYGSATCSHSIHVRGAKSLACPGDPDMGLITDLAVAWTHEMLRGASWEMGISTDAGRVAAHTLTFAVHLVFVEPLEPIVVSPTPSIGLIAPCNGCLDAYRSRCGPVRFGRVPDRGALPSLDDPSQDSP